MQDLVMSLSKASVRLALDGWDRDLEIDFLDDNYTIITGRNAGGKTLALKCIGDFCDYLREPSNSKFDRLGGFFMQRKKSWQSDGGENRILDSMQTQHEYEWLDYKDNTGLPLVDSTLIKWYTLENDNANFEETPKINMPTLASRLLVDEEKLKKSFREDKILFIGDSFTFGVGLNWEETFVGILNKDFNLNAINAGVNSYSPTVYKYKLRNLIKKGLIDSNQKIVIGLDISDVFDESTRWTEYKGRPANIEKIQKLKNLPLTGQINEKDISTNHKKLKQSNFYNKKNFKLTYQIYYGLENFVKNYIDDIQVRNNDRSKFTHKEWSLIEDKYSPLGIEEGLKKNQREFSANFTTYC